MGKTIGSPERWASIKTSLKEKVMPDRYTISYLRNTGYTDYGVAEQVYEQQYYEGSTLIPCLLQEYRVYRETETRYGQDVLTNAYELTFPHDAPMRVNAKIQINSKEYEVAKIVENSEWLGAKSAFIIELERQASDD